MGVMCVTCGGWPGGLCDVSSWYECYVYMCHGCVCVWVYVCKFMHWVLCVSWLCVYVGVMCESGGGVCECKFMV